MNKKIIVQLILFFIIILFTSLFLFKYFFSNQTEISKITKNNLASDLKVNSSNIIENIEYKSSDNQGNQYIIKAKYGEILFENDNTILMRDVVAVIIFSNYEKINITSEIAIYSINNYDTNFEKNVSIKYDNQILLSDNLDLLIKDNKIKLYNNVNYNNLNTDFLADQVEIDLLTKDLKIYMNNQGKKIKAIYNNEIN
tara:strand:+ start:701 stop:1294 length:594 start_codon:yes stop_codon:yes gene_type:complete